MSNADWWARRLNAPQPVRQEIAPTYQSLPPAIPAPDNAQASRVQKKHSQGYCPECGSDNFFKATEQTMARCFECGYPVRHTTSGMGNTHAQSTASRQNNPKGVSHFEPQTIVGRVG